MGIRSAAVRDSTRGDRRLPLKEHPPGERGAVMCLAANGRQARTVLRYVLGFFDSIPMLNKQGKRLR